MAKYCNITKCRFPGTHTSMGHKCGQCTIFGHGKIECGNQHLIEDIAHQYYNDILPADIRCMYGGCNSKEYHTSESHHCLKCHGLMHSIETCPTNPIIKDDIIVECPLCKAINNISSEQTIIKGATDDCVVCMDAKVEILFPKCKHVCVCDSCMKKLNKTPKQTEFNVFDSIRNEQQLISQSYQIDYIKSLLKTYPSYLLVYEGMGCVSIIRRINPHSEIEALFNHSDDHYSVEKTNKINDFITGHCRIDNESLITHEWVGY